MNVGLVVGVFIWIAKGPLGIEGAMHAPSPMIFAAMHESACGTKPTSSNVRYPVGDGGESVGFARADF